MGVAFGDEKPGSALFGVPILFSIAGGAIGWLGSISKKKRAELVDRESNASTPT